MPIIKTILPKQEKTNALKRLARDSESKLSQEQKIKQKDLISNLNQVYRKNDDSKPYVEIAYPQDDTAYFDCVDSFESHDDKFFDCIDYERIYRSPVEYIRMILSDPTLGDDGPEFMSSHLNLAPELLGNHIGYLLEYDEKIKSNNWLKQKYKSLKKQVEQCAKWTEVSVSERAILIDYINNNITAKDSEKKLEKIYNDFSLGVFESLNKNEKTLVPMIVPEHAFLVQFEKEKNSRGVFDGKYTVRIINSGGGIENHNQLILNSRSGIKYDPCFTIKNIDKKSLTLIEIKYLLDFSMGNTYCRYVKDSFSVQALKFHGGALNPKSNIDAVYLFFLSIGEYDEKTINPLHSPQKIGNCSTRCFHSWLNYELNNDKQAFQYKNSGNVGLYAYFMKSFYEAICENNFTKVTPELLQKFGSKKKKYEIKEKIAIYKKNYIKQNATANVFQFMGSKKDESKDIQKIKIKLKYHKNFSKALYYQQDTKELFVFRRLSYLAGIIKQVVGERLVFSPDHKEPKSKKIT